MNTIEASNGKGVLTTERMEVDLELTPAQIRALSGHAKAMAEGRIVLRMLTDGDIYGKVKVAAYTYSGSTCCC